MKPTKRVEWVACSKYLAKLGHNPEHFCHPSELEVDRFIAGWPKSNFMFKIKRTIIEEVVK